MAPGIITHLHATALLACSPRWLCIGWECTPWLWHLNNNINIRCIYYIIFDGLVSALGHGFPSIILIVLHGLERYDCHWAGNWILVLYKCIIIIFRVPTYCLSDCLNVCLQCSFAILVIPSNILLYFYWDRICIKSYRLDSRMEWCCFQNEMRRDLIPINQSMITYSSIGDVFTIHRDRKEIALNKT